LASICVYVAIKYNEKQVYEGRLLQDSMFFLLSTFFVCVFFYAIMMIKKALRQVKQTKHYMDERVICLQLVTFSVFLFVDTCHNILRDWLLKADETEIKTCNVSIAVLVLLIADLLIKMLLLAIILIMTVRQSSKIKTHADAKRRKLLFAHVDIKDGSHNEI
jgi:hypothetical protein